MSSKKTTAAEETAATTEATATAAAVKTVADATAAADEAMAYLGPDIKLVTVNGTVYTGGLPKALEDKIKELPALKGLIVPVSDLAAASVAIRTPGTALYNLYNAVSEKLQAQQKK